MKYSAQYYVFHATFHVISRKVDFIWDCVLYRNYSIMKTFVKLLCLITLMFLNNHFPFPLFTILDCQFTCTCEDPAFIACMSPLWQAGYSLVLITFSIYLSFAGIEIVVSLLIFSVHICVNIESTNYTVLVQCHGSLWSGSVSLMQI